jgi:phytoene dehydrogenase-like protein
MARANVVVVGGGAAGLAAAALLGRAQARVTLFEAGKQFGGRALTNEREGFAFNMGAHALYPGVARDVLRELAVEVTGGAPRVRGGLLLEPDRAHAMPAGALGLVFMTSLTWAERGALVRAFARAARPPSPALAHSSCETFLCAQTELPRVRAILRSFFRISSYVASLDRLDAMTACRQLALANRGVRYLDGGFQTIVDGLARRARETGAELLTQAPVRSLRVEEGRVRGVALKDGRFVPSDAVILAIAPHQIAALLSDDAESRDLAGRTTKVRAACLDLGLRKLPRPHVPFALGLDSPLYLSTHSLSAKLAPEGHEVVHLIRYLRADEQVSPDDARAELEALMERVQPGYRAQVVTSQFLPNITVMEGFPEAAYGGVQGRPRVAHASIAGVFRAGDWVGDEGMLLDAALASARVAARLSVLGTQRTAA